MMEELKSEVFKQKKGWDLPLAEKMARNWVNILNVAPVLSDGTSVGYVIMFEYHFCATTMEGWRKYAVYWDDNWGGLSIAIEYCCELATQLRTTLEAES